MLFCNLRYITLLAITLLLTGCGLFGTKEQPSTLPKIANEQLWQQHQQKINQLKSWQVDGKVGIKTNTDSGSASLFWLQQETYYDIRLAGPLGRGATRIVGNTGKVTMEISGQGRFTAATPEELLKQQLGWNLPISHLAWWIKGLPAPDAPYVNVLNSDSQLAQLKQDDWTIRYDSYQQVQGYWLPQRIVAESADMRVILVIKQWTLKNANPVVASR